MTRALPSIGVTGIVTDHDVSIIADCVPMLPPTHRLMAGVLVSAKTLRGDATANRRYPPVRSAEPLLSALAAAGAWPVVHFNCRDGLDDHLARLAEQCPSMRGLQLNVSAPDYSAVDRFLRRRPDVEFILQVNHSAALPGGVVTSDSVANYVERYAGVATHALVDLSGGEGRPLHINLAEQVLGAWRSEWHVRPSFAGGLGPDAALTLHVFAQRAAQTTHPLRACSLDVETNVRVPVPDPIVGERYQDMLDGGKAGRWVAMASAFARADAGVS